MSFLALFIVINAIWNLTLPLRLQLTLGPVPVCCPCPDHHNWHIAYPLYRLFLFPALFRVMDLFLNPTLFPLIEHCWVVFGTGSRFGLTYNQNSESESCGLKGFFCILFFTFFFTPSLPFYSMSHLFIFLLPWISFMSLLPVVLVSLLQVIPFITVTRAAPLYICYGTHLCQGVWKGEKFKDGSVFFFSFEDPNPLLHLIT